jgi:hypothetical protein
MNTFETLTALTRTHDSFRSDFERRYHNTYILLMTPSTKGELVPHFVSGQVSTYVYRFRNVLSGKDIDIDITVKDDNEETYKARVFIPEAGYYILNGEVFYICQRPTRQWQRSFNGRNYNIFALSNGKQYRNPSAEQVRAIFEKNHISLDNAQPHCEHVLTTKLCIQPNKDNTSNLLYRRVKIGTLDFDKKSITLTCDLIRQELIDILKRTGVCTWTFR